MVKIKRKASMVVAEVAVETTFTSIQASTTIKNIFPDLQNLRADVPKVILGIARDGEMPVVDCAWSVGRHHNVSLLPRSPSPFLATKRMIVPNLSYEWHPGDIRVEVPKLQLDRQGELPLDFLEKDSH